MIVINLKTTINQPVEDVFDRLVDINSYPEWLPKSRVFLDSHLTSDGPIGPVTTFIDKTRYGIYHGVIDEFERPAKVTFRMRLRWFSLNVMESRPGYSLQEVEGETHLHHHAEGELFGIFKIMEPFVAVIAREERTRTVELLQSSLESKI